MRPDTTVEVRVYDTTLGLPRRITRRATTRPERSLLILPTGVIAAAWIASLLYLATSIAGAIG
jgi:hypothetical protein